MLAVDLFHIYCIEMFDAVSYWIKRYEEGQGEYQPSYSKKSADLRFETIFRAYDRCINCLGIDLVDQEVLDVGCGRGFLTEYFISRGVKVSVVDLSEKAISFVKQKHPEIRDFTGRITEIDFSDESFDIVHCAEVLFHVLEDKEWRESIDRLCSLSRKYVFLKERFTDSPKKTALPHVKPRRCGSYISQMGKNGFKKIHTQATQYLGWFPLSKGYVLAPKVINNLDRILINLSTPIFLSSNQLKIFEKM